MSYGFGHHLYSSVRLLRWVIHVAVSLDNKRVEFTAGLTVGRNISSVFRTNSSSGLHTALSSSNHKPSVLPTSFLFEFLRCPLITFDSTEIPLCNGIHRMALIQSKPACNWQDNAPRSVHVPVSSIKTGYLTRQQ